MFGFTGPKHLLQIGELKALAGPEKFCTTSSVETELPEQHEACDDRWEREPCRRFVDWLDRLCGETEPSGLSNLFDERGSANPRQPIHFATR